MPLVYLAAGLIVLPIAYIILCKRMSRAVAKPPKAPFFFVFGSIGGYLLLLAFAPSFLSLLLALPFALAAFIAVTYGLIASLVAKPRTRFHKAAAAASGLLLPLMIWCVFSPSCGGLSYAGQWDDDRGNWTRAMNGQPLPPDVHVLHSRYRRSPHFTYEASYFFEFTAQEEFLRNWIAFQKLELTPPSEENTPRYYDKPDWFIPKPLSDYDMWMPIGNPFDDFRIYRDRTTGTLYVADSQGGG